MKNHPLPTINLQKLLSAFLPKLLPVLLLVILCNTAVAQAPADQNATKSGTSIDNELTPVEGPAIKTRPTRGTTVPQGTSPATTATQGKEQEVAPAMAPQ